MSKLTESFREVRVFNVYGFYGVGNVYVSYDAAVTGRAGRPAVVRVCRPGFMTDPGSHWQDHGNKTFHVFVHRGTAKERREATVAEAQAWASERFGITKWMKDPYGCWGDAEFVAHRIKELQAAVKELVA